MARGIDSAVGPPSRGGPAGARNSRFVVSLDAAGPDRLAGPTAESVRRAEANGAALTNPLLPSEGAGPVPLGSRDLLTRTNFRDEMDAQDAQFLALYESREIQCLRLHRSTLWSPLVRLITLPLLAAAMIAGPALADPGKQDLEKALDRAKKDKKYLAAVFTLYN